MGVVRVYVSARARSLQATLDFDDSDTVHHTNDFRQKQTIDVIASSLQI